MVITNQEKKIRKFRSLRVTLAIAFLTLSAAVLLVAGGLQMYFSFRAQQRIIAEQQQLIAKDAANTVKSFIIEKFSILEKVVTLGGRLAIVGQKEQKLTLEELLGKELSFRQLILFNTEGRELVKASRLSELLSEQLIKYDKDELFSKVSQKEIYISSVYIDEMTSEPMVVMAVPLTDVFGDFRGILMAEVNLKFMWDTVATIKIGEAGLAYVVDKDGDLIAFNDIARVLRGENLIHLKEVSEFVKGEDLTYQPGADISKGIQDTYVISNHAHLVTPDWAVVVELPALEAYQAVIYGIGLSIGIIILSAIFAAWIGFYLSARITKPIISLRNAAIEIGKGKLDTKIEIKTKDEIGELAAAFDQMTKDLQESRVELEKYSKELEKKVRERTKELESKMAELERFNKLAVGRELKMVELKKTIKKLEEQLKKTKPAS